MLKSNDHHLTLGLQVLPDIKNENETELANESKSPEMRTLVMLHVYMRGCHKDCRKNVILGNVLPIHHHAYVMLVL